MQKGEVVIGYSFNLFVICMHFLDIFQDRSRISDRKKVKKKTKIYMFLTLKNEQSEAGFVNKNEYYAKLCANV